MNFHILLVVGYIVLVTFVAIWVMYDHLHMKRIENFAQAQVDFCNQSLAEGRGGYFRIMKKEFDAVIWSEYDAKFFRDNLEPNLKYQVYGRYVVFSPIND